MDEDLDDEIIKEEIEKAKNEVCPCGCGEKPTVKYAQINEEELKKNWIEIGPGEYKKKASKDQ